MMNGKGCLFLSCDRKMTLPSSLYPPCVSEASRPASSAGYNGNEHPDTNGDIAGVIARPPAISPQQSSTSPTLRASGEAFDGIDKPPSIHSEADHDDSNSQSTHTTSVVDSESTFATPAKQENAGVWGGSWRRDSKLTRTQLAWIDTIYESSKALQIYVLPCRSWCFIQCKHRV